MACRDADPVDTKGSMRMAEDAIEANRYTSGLEEPPRIHGELKMLGFNI
jgi:hypothetical protein